MFFCCPGGGRKLKTKEDLVEAAVGFAADASSAADRVPSHRGQQDDVSAVASNANSVDRAHMGLAGRMVAPVHTPVPAPGHASTHDSGQGTPPGYRSRPSTAGVRSPPPTTPEEKFWQ